MNVLKKLMGGAYKIASTEIAVKNGLGKAVTLDTLPMGFKYSTAEQWTGEYWIDGSKIYTKSFMYDGMNAANDNIIISTGLSSSTIQDVWIDESQSFARTNTNSMVFPVNYISVSEYYRLATNLIDLLTSNIRIDIKWNANTKLNRMRITLKYTYK